MTDCACDTCREHEFMSPGWIESCLQKSEELYEEARKTELMRKAAQRLLQADIDRAAERIRNRPRGYHEVDGSHVVYKSRAVGRTERMPTTAREIAAWGQPFGIAIHPNSLKEVHKWHGRPRTNTRADIPLPNPVKAVDMVAVLYQAPR